MDMNLKIGVLSDTHLHGVTKSFRDIYEKYIKGMDIILHAGDFVNVEVADFLNGENFHGVHGNMDPFDVREMLPPKKLIELGHYRIGLMHGWGSSKGLEERVRPEFQNPDVIVYGHSHRPANHMKDGVLFFNPGTAIGYSSNGVHTIGVIHVGDEIYGEIINV